MQKFSAEVIVKLKDEIKDIQGLCVDKTLKRLGFESETNFRAGKYYSFNLQAKDKDEAREKLDFVCNEVISNPVVEKYDIISFKEVL